MGADPRIAGFPNGVIPLTVSSIQGANTTITATLTGIAGETVFISRLTITNGGATAAGMTSCQVTGLTSISTLSLMVGAPVGAGVPGVPTDLEFNPPIPATDPAVGIKATLGALGTGNTHASIVLQGFKA